MHIHCQSQHSGRQLSNELCRSIRCQPRPRQVWQTWHPDVIWASHKRPQYHRPQCMRHWNSHLSWCSDTGGRRGGFGTAWHRAGLAWDGGAHVCTADDGPAAVNSDHRGDGHTSDQQRKHPWLLGHQRTFGVICYKNKGNKPQNYYLLTELPNLTLCFAGSSVQEGVPSIGG